MTLQSLQQKMDQAGGALPMMRNSQTGPYAFPIPPEFSNWRDEQRAWREGVALMDQSYHMTDLYVEGRDVHKFVSSLAVNSFAGFGDNKANGQRLRAIGLPGGRHDHLGLGENLVNFVGRPTVANWVEFNAHTGGYDVSVDRDERTLENNPKPRKTFRFEIQGPDAWRLMRNFDGGPLEQPRFFQMGRLNVAGRSLRSLRHGMGGAPGLEFWGPVEQGAEVKAAILAAGGELAAPGGIARLCQRRGGFRLAAVPDARHLFRRRHARLPRVAAGAPLRCHRLGGGQLHLRPHRGLLLHAVGHRLRPPVDPLRP